MKFRDFTIVAAAAGLFATAPAQAAITFYTTHDGFDAATINPQAPETFETAPSGGNKQYPTGYNGKGFVVSGAGGYTVTVAPNIPNSQSWYDWGSGDSLLYGPGGTAVFSFFQPVTAFSIDLATFLSSEGTVTVSGAGFSTTVKTANNPTRTFFGLTSDVGLSNFTLHTSGRDYGLADNFTIASIAPPVAAVPEPATWAMVLVGFGLVGKAARSRRSRMSIAYA